MDLKEEKKKLRINLETNIKVKTRLDVCAAPENTFDQCVVNILSIFLLPLLVRKNTLFTSRRFESNRGSAGSSCIAGGSTDIYYRIKDFITTTFPTAQINKN